MALMQNSPSQRNTGVAESGYETVSESLCHSATPEYLYAGFENHTTFFKISAWINGDSAGRGGDTSTGYRHCTDATNTSNGHAEW
jgi:hypothetical protein